MKHVSEGSAWLLAVVLAALLFGPVDALAARRASAPVTAAGEAVLRFPASDGWDGGVLRYSPLSEVLVLKFKRGAEDPVTSLAPSLGREQRHVFARVEAVHNERGTMTVRVHVERRGYTAALRRNARARAWELTVTLPPPDELAPVSYAALLPEGNPRDALAAVEETMRAGAPSCRPLQALRRSGEGWSAWVSLRLADCLRQSGESGASVGLALDLAGNPDVPPAVAALASLRLEEWALNLHSAMEPNISPDMVSGLPRDVAFELGLRVARTLTFRQRPREAAAALVATDSLGATPPSLVEGHNWVRLQVLHQLADAESWFDAARVFASGALPSLGSSSREGTLRLGTLALARLGVADRAAAVGSVILRTGGKVVDPELMGAMSEALFALGRHEEAAAILADAGRRVVPAAGVVFSETEARGVAARLVASWRSLGLASVLGLLRGVDGFDPRGLLREVTLAALLAEGDCTAVDAASPANVVPGHHTWAAACWLRARDPEAAAASATLDSLAPEGSSADELERAVADHAVRTASFMARMDGRLNPRPAPVPSVVEAAPVRQGRRSR